MNQSVPKYFGLSVFDRLFGYLDSLKPSDRWILSLVLTIFFLSSLLTITLVSWAYLVKIPTGGGVLIEGAIGSPRFINPVLAITRADNDLTALTYSGLLRLAPDGTLENDLAESVTISDDGLVYNIILKQDRYFHDGSKIKAEDVAFTVGLIQKPGIKSPLYGNWSGVAVEVINDYELNFVLQMPYSPFKENLTVGILPKHVWSTLTEEELPFSQHNIEPIGSGIFEVKKVEHNPAGLISRYELRVTSQYKDESNIDNVIIRFYQNENELIEALKKGEINSTAYLSEQWLSLISTKEYNLISEPLPRVFSIFFNQNKNPALRDNSVRAALEILIDREELLKNAVDGYGYAANSPIPPEWIAGISTSTIKTKEERHREARAILENGGWRQSVNGRWVKTIDGVEMPLMFSVRSSNGILFEDIASYLSNTWKEIGIEATFEFYEQSDLIQTVIRPRDYQALLFGIDVGRSLDLYPFWHSASREDPGLNVSLYANITTDRLVSEIRTATSTIDRDEKILSFIGQLQEERPSIFLFAPSFEYVAKSKIFTAEMTKIQKQSERFSNITKWHMNESNVWPIFKND